MIPAAKLTIGPVLFHWPTDLWLDFYKKIADEAPVDVVYLGEVICSKRAPLKERYYQDVVEKLQRAGKQIVFSTLSEVTVKHDRNAVKSVCEMEDYLIEANDISALQQLAGRQHAIGPYVNIYNEDSLQFVAKRGARHLCLPVELPAKSIVLLTKAAREVGVSVEAQIYGRLPLALSARCYHARAHGRIKDNCQYACEADCNGLDMKSVTGQEFLVVNGVQTLSHGCLNLAAELGILQTAGVTHFRLNPQNVDMIQVARIFKDLLLQHITATDAIRQLKPIWPGVPFVNGFIHGAPGHTWRDANGQPG